MLDKIVKAVSTFARRTCFCFSAIVLFMSLVGWSINSDDLMKFFSYEQTFSFFIFSLCFAISFFVADFVKNNVILKRTAQFVLTMLSVFAVFANGSLFNNYVDGEIVQNPAFSMLAIMFYAIMIYTACALIYLLSKFIFGLIKTKMGVDEDKYENVYTNKK